MERRERLLSGMLHAHELSRCSVIPNFFCNGDHCIEFEYLTRWSRHRSALADIKFLVTVLLTSLIEGSYLSTLLQSCRKQSVYSTDKARTQRPQFPCFEHQNMKPPFPDFEFTDSIVP
jgi:hypothetical protein